MADYNLSIRSSYTRMSDSDLDMVIQEMQVQFPNWGNRHVYSYLIS